VPLKVWIHKSTISKEQKQNKKKERLTFFFFGSIFLFFFAGEGLGNAFLSHISAVDGIYHVVRCFEDATVTHVEDSVDPIRDLNTITDELRRKDIQHMTKLMPDMVRMAAQTDKSKKKDLVVAERVLELLKESADLRSQKWTARDIEVINTFYLLSIKPVIYLANLTPRDYIRKRNKWLPKIAEWAKEHGDEPVIPFSAAYEAQVAAIDDIEERRKFCRENKAPSVIPKIVRSGYQHLDLINFFTTGADEVRAWTIRRGTKAPQAAGVIHGDFEAGFICAEVAPYAALEEHGSEAAAKAKGQQRTQGKEYIVESGDCILFKFNASAGGKKKK
jgi:obg-like ATPase 1